MNSSFCAFAAAARAAERICYSGHISGLKKCHVKSLIIDKQLCISGLCPAPRDLACLGDRHLTGDMMNREAVLNG